MSDKKFLAQRWEALSPKARRMTVVGAVGAVAFFLIYLFVTASPSQTQRVDPREAVVQDILTDADTRALGIDGLNNRTAALEGTVEDMTQRIADLTHELEQANSQAVSAGELAAQLESLREALAQQQANQTNGEPSSSDTDAGAPTDPAAPSQPSVPAPAPDIWNEPAPVATTSPEEAARAQEAGDSAASASPIDIRVIGGGDDAVAAAEARGANEDGVYLPAGSIISGVLVTGMDAPTNNAARSEPFPALVRVKKDAILPNRYRLDVRECFIIASGYGSLSAERAYLRAEVLSCVRRDGGVIEVPLAAYAVGEDGKVGLRGRVVSKQGQMLAKSLTAGFFSGMSEVFGQAPIPTIQTSASGDVAYQDVLSSESVTAGAVEGASSALDRLAQFYLDMAENIFPVIEINANRQVEFIVTQGGWLKTVSSQGGQ